MRIKKLEDIYSLFHKNGSVSLKSADTVGGAMSFVLAGKHWSGVQLVNTTGFASHYEEEEIRTLNEAVSYIWRERKRYIEE